MPDQNPRSGTSPLLTSIEAQLFVPDIEASCAFFVEKLSFKVVFTFGEPPFYAQVKRDAAKLNLRHVDRSPFVDGIRERESLLAATITVGGAAELRELFATYRACGVEFHQTFKHQAWGACDFIVRDPDGNLLLFAGPAG